VKHKQPARSKQQQELVCILKNRHKVGAYIFEQRFFSIHMVAHTLTIGYSLKVKICVYNTPAEVRLLMTFRQAPIICRNALKRVPV
jgi:hypothetical protein